MMTLAGWGYLLSTNNIKYETLLPGVRGEGANKNSLVNGAWRPGVDKITFVRVALDPMTGDMSPPLRNYYTDNYITNGCLMQQQVVRVISQPDILFSAGDVNAGSTTPFFSTFSRSGTTNWINNAALNGNSGGAGPGVISPQVKIIFGKLGRFFVTAGSYSDELAAAYTDAYSSFDGSTNSPIIYPIPQTGSCQMTVRLWLMMGSNPNLSYHLSEWKPASTSGAKFAMQTSTNLTSWITLFAVTNDSSVCNYVVGNPASAARFYRLVPQ